MSLNANPTPEPEHTPAQPPAPPQPAQTVPPAPPAPMEKPAPPQPAQGASAPAAPVTAQPAAETEPAAPEVAQAETEQEPVAEASVPSNKTEEEKTAQPKKPGIGARIKRFLQKAGRGIVLLFCACASGGLLYISFPQVSASGWAWLALFPFIWAVTKLRGFWSSFWYGFLTGLVFHAAALYWIYYTCVHGGGLAPSLAAAAWIGLAGLLSLQTAVFGGSCYYLKKTGLFFPLLAACGWVALEWLHQTVAFYGIGFPWFMLGGTQWNSLEPLQLASLTGVYGVSFVLVWCGTQLGWAFSGPSVKKVTGSILIAAAVFFSVYGFGNYRLEQLRQAERKPALLSIQAVLMQPNIDQYKKWDEAYEQEIRDTLSNLGHQVAPGSALLTVWPENATPGALADPVYGKLFEDLAHDTQTYQFVGSFLPEQENQYVGAYLVPPDSHAWQLYEKIKLVPFGEFVPLSGTLQRVFPHVEVLGELGSFTPGERYQNLLNINGVLLGSTICYEAIFPQIWLTQARSGAKLFVNITNDAWFFNTAAPHQHLAANVVRAVETGRPVLRAANTGISAWISPSGKIEKQTHLFTQQILTAQVPLSLKETATFYAQWGDWFAWLCAAVFFTILISVMVFAYE